MLVRFEFCWTNGQRVAFVQSDAASQLLCGCRGRSLFWSSVQSWKASRGLVANDVPLARGSLLSCSQLFCLHFDCDFELWILLFDLLFNLLAFCSITCRLLSVLLFDISGGPYFRRIECHQED